MIDPHDFPPHEKICLGHEGYVCNVSLEGEHHSRKRCVSCAREYKKESAKRLRNERKARGVCSVGGCGAWVAEGRTYCAFHLDAMNESIRILREERKAKGICTRCETTKAVKGHELCEEHMLIMQEGQKRRYDERKAQDVCVNGLCGAKVAKGHIYCPEHLSYPKKRREARKAEGKCTECEAKPVEGYLLCEKHLSASREASKRSKANKKLASVS